MKRLKYVLETFIGLEQRMAPGTKPRIPRVVSKSDSDHGTTTAHRTLGVTPAGTICRSNLSLSHYPILLHTGSEERGVFWVGSIPVEILPSCQ